VRAYLSGVGGSSVGVALLELRNCASVMILVVPMVLSPMVPLYPKERRANAPRPLLGSVGGPMR
jgi:hypothetical protein